MVWQARVLVCGTRASGGLSLRGKEWTQCLVVPNVKCRELAANDITLPAFGLSQRAAQVAGFPGPRRPGRDVVNNSRLGPERFCGLPLARVAVHNCASAPPGWSFESTRWLRSHYNLPPASACCKGICGTGLGAESPPPAGPWPDMKERRAFET